MDIEPQSVIPQKRKRVKRGQPTIKQVKALQYINQGMSTRGALIKAGYSVKVANKSNEFFKNKGVIKAVESMKGILENAGITNVKIAYKIAEFVDAQKVHSSMTEPDRVVPDYKTQIEGVKMAIELSKVGPQAPTKKRELTITEFVTGEESASE